MTITVSMRDMLEAGIHFGHQKRYWNPKMDAYIYGVRHNIHIINLETSLPMFRRAIDFVQETATNRGKVLFVGTKHSARKVVQEEATRCGMPYVDHRWLGGMLTNYKTIRQSIKRLKDLEERLSDEENLAGMTKKEVLGLMRTKDKLHTNLAGIKNMGGLPDVIFVIDVGMEKIAVQEAKRLGIPVIGVADTNADPADIDYLIPGNDDAVRSIRFYCKTFAEVIIEARGAAELLAIEEAKKDEKSADEKPKKKIVAKKVKKVKVEEKAPTPEVKAEAKPQETKAAPAAAITAPMVRELRDKTGAPMMDCKKALKEAGADIEAAVEILRKSGKAKAARRGGKTAAEGKVVIRVDADQKTGFIVEVNSETDFVARDENFNAFADKVAEAGLSNKSQDVTATLASQDGEQSLEQARESLVARIGENIQLRRVALLESANYVSQYCHGDRIGVLVALKSADEALAKDVAMHIAASNPQALRAEEVPAELIEKERNIFITQAEESGKPKEIAEKMVTGRVQKFLKEISLLDQPFVKNPDISVGELVKQAGNQIETFVRFEVGEGIEKETQDFADEVMAQVKGSD